MPDSAGLDVELEVVAFPHDAALEPGVGRVALGDFQIRVASGNEHRHDVVAAAVRAPPPALLQDQLLAERIQPVRLAQAQEQRQFVLGRVGRDGPARQIDLLGRPAGKQLAYLGQFGPGRRAENTGELIEIDLSVGDVVIYSKYGGTEVTVDGEDLLILSSRDVLAKETAGKKKK